MELLRLRGRKICDRLLRHGKVWKGKHMTVRWLPGHPRHPAAKVMQSGIYVGTITSTKLDKSAVRRNRMRRRCREALRLILREDHIASAGGDASAGKIAIQLLLAPRSSSLSAPFPELQADLTAFLRLHGFNPKKAK